MKNQFLIFILIITQNIFCYDRSREYKTEINGTIYINPNNKRLIVFKNICGWMDEIEDDDLLVNLMVEYDLDKSFEFYQFPLSIFRNKDKSFMEANQKLIFKRRDEKFIALSLDKNFIEALKTSYNQIIQYKPKCTIL